MARGGNLDAKTVEAAKKRATAYRLSDGGGLLLLVKPSGAKMWVLRFTVGGKRRDMGLGSFPAVSLKAARDAAAEHRKAAAAGVDPIQAKEAQRKADADRRAADAEAQDRTFRKVAAACIKAEAPGWKSHRTALLWETSLARHVYPTLGNMAVAEIDRTAVRRAIDDVWTNRPATARKVLRRIGAVLRYAAAHGWRANDNPADMRMLRYAGLPALPGGRKQPSLAWQRLPALRCAWWC